MAAKANAAVHYRFRIALFAIACLGMSAWMFYDAFVAFPHDNMIFAEYERFKQDGRAEEWPAHARANGWPDGTYTEPKPHSSFSVMFNTVVGVALLPIGIACLYTIVTYRNRWIAADDQAITTSWGPRCEIARIHQLDLTRWFTKGIAFVIYDDGTGGSLRLVLDDWKYDRAPIREIVKTLESRLKPEQIIGRPQAPVSSSSASAPVTPSSNPR